MLEVDEAMAITRAAFWEGVVLGAQIGMQLHLSDDDEERDKAVHHICEKAKEAFRDLFATRGIDLEKG